MNRFLKPDFNRNWYYICTVFSILLIFNLELHSRIKKSVTYTERNQTSISYVNGHPRPRFDTVTYFVGHILHYWVPFPLLKNQSFPFFPETQYSEI